MHAQQVQLAAAQRQTSPILFRTDANSRRMGGDGKTADGKLADDKYKVTGKTE